MTDAQSRYGELPEKANNPPLWPLTTVMRDLLLHPDQVLRPYAEGPVSHHEVLFKSMVFLLFASLFFAITAVIGEPALSKWQLTLRFFFTFGVSLLFLFPFLVVIWSLLQRLTSWYLDFSLTFPQILGVSGLGLYYFALMFLLGIPVLILKPSQPFLYDGLLGLLLLGALWLFMRLFKRAYQVMGGANPKRAILAAFFPFIIVAVVWFATAILTYFASQHTGAGAMGS